MRDSVSDTARKLRTSPETHRENLERPHFAILLASTRSTDNDLGTSCALALFSNDLRPLGEVDSCRIVSLNEEASAIAAEDVTQPRTYSDSRTLL